MSFEVKVIADSISPAEKRLLTFKLRYPRFIHAELMTHRLFSRNASSSRAIPVKKMIEELRRDPAMPTFWGSNRPGMQAGEEIDDIATCKELWLAARDQMIVVAQSMIDGFELHKQIANRILEPWAHINVVVTATDWQNFYTLRRHKDAQPEIKHLADLMWEAQRLSVPHELQPGEWHLPFITGDELEGASEADAIDSVIKVSVARCARVSYLTHDGRQTTIEEDLALYDRLLGSQPLHASPAEHQATPDEQIDWDDGTSGWANPDMHGNLTGWCQFRKMLPGEFVAG